MAIAMSGEMLNDLRHGRGQGNWFLNLLAPFGYWAITALFNVFPLPRARGFARSFLHAGEAMGPGLFRAGVSGGHAQQDRSAGAVPSGHRAAGTTGAGTDCAGGSAWPGRRAGAAVDPVRCVSRSASALPFRLAAR